MKDTRGHDLGWIGVTLAADRRPPDATEIKARVQAIVYAKKEDA